MTGPRNLFQRSRKFASGHVCGVVFGQRDMPRLQALTREWECREWCTYDERQLFLNDCHTIIARWRVGQLLLQWVRDQFHQARAKA